MLCSQNVDLYTACVNGDVAEVETLLLQGANVDYHDQIKDYVSCVSYCGDSCSSRCVIHTSNEKDF